MKATTSSAWALLALTIPLAAAAQAAAGPAPAPAPAPGSLRAELLVQLDDAASKLERLATAIPQGKFTWRPAAGVRSVGEVLMHVVGANYYIAGLTGAAPAAAPPADTNVVQQAQIVDQLRRSFEHVRTGIRGMTDADLDKPVTMFGRQTTSRGVLLLTVTHAHEHLGQLIAYARANGVAPPWSGGD